MTGRLNAPIVLAGVGYQAWRAWLDGVDNQMHRIPEWDELSDADRNAWVAAANAVVAEVIHL